MKKLFWGLAALILIAIAALWLLGREPQTMQVSDLPWQIEPTSNGSIRVFGITLGETNLDEASRHFGKVPDMAVFVGAAGPESIEAFYGKRVRHVFMLTGGGAMHLNDAMGRVDGLRYVCCHHEQALAMAAESYTRLSGRLAALNVTTGPGGINALNGVHGAFTDSIAMIVVSGQVKRETLASNAPVRLRQLGDQEVDIVSMVKPITKYAVTVTDPQDIRYALEKALWLAETGRPGPVWLDIPIDVQAAPIEPDTLHGFDPVREGYGRPFALPAEYGWLQGEALDEAARKVIAALRAAQRPVLMPGCS